MKIAAVSLSHAVRFAQEKFDIKVFAKYFYDLPEFGVSVAFLRTSVDNSSLSNFWIIKREFLKFEFIKSVVLDNALANGDTVDSFLLDIASKSGELDIFSAISFPYDDACMDIIYKYKKIKHISVKLEELKKQRLIEMEKMLSAAPLKVGSRFELFGFGESFINDGLVIEHLVIEIIRITGTSVFFQHEYQEFNERGEKLLPCVKIYGRAFPLSKVVPRSFRACDITVLQVDGLEFTAVETKDLIDDQPIL